MTGQDAANAQVRLTRQGDVAVITIDNPPINAGSHAVRRGLLACLAEVEADAFKPGLAKIGLADGGVAQVHLAEVTVDHAHPLEGRFHQVGAAQRAANEGDPLEAGTLQAHVVHLAIDERDIVQAGLIKVGA